MDNNTVTKALSQEEQTVIANIKSMCDELLSMSPDQQAPAADQTATPPQQTMTASKAVVSTPSEQVTANDDAEETIDGLIPEETDESLKQVSKMLAPLLIAMSKQQNKVVKSKDPLIEAVEGLTKVVQKTVENQNVLSETVGGLLDGIGITKQMEIVQKAKENKPQPILSPDALAIVQALQNSFVNKSENNQGANTARDFGPRNVTKSLSQEQSGISALEMLVGGGRAIRR